MQPHAFRRLTAVVARYREELSWLQESGLPAIVYDKSGEADCASARQQTAGAAVDIRPLPNMGRESHTYLQHIVAAYPNFPDATLFIQGNPFPHLPQNMGPAALAAEAQRLADKGAPFKGLAFYSLKCDHLGRPHSMSDPAKAGKWPGWGKDIPVGRVYAELFAGPVPLRYHAKGAASLFLVSRKRLLSRPLALYRRALELILDDPHDAENTGHAFERLWSVIFNGYAPLHEGKYPQDSATAAP